MNEKLQEIKEIHLDDLIPFQHQSSQAYEGDRLNQLVSSIERVGLMSPIIVRPVDNEKYEIICGHNRVNAMKKLGRDTIRAEVWEGLSNDEAMELFYDSNLNQQSFSDWSYSQRIKAIQYTETLIKKEGQQGKRSDLAEKKDATTDGDTSVQDGHKSDEKPRRSTTRDRMARRLGIATATLSKYRSIIKLPDDLIESLARLLDEGDITFEAVYRISRLAPPNAKILVECIEESPDKKVDLVKLKELCPRSKKTKGGIEPVLSKVALSGVLVPIPSKLPVKHRN